MKILTIPDLHGNDIWKDILFGSTYDYNNWVNNEVANNIGDFFDYPYREYDKIVFLGDYVDSYTYTNIEILKNLIDIIHLKKHLNDRIILLLGNHDVQYFVPNKICSGCRTEMMPELNILFKENINLFGIAYEYKNHLWSHAGVTNNFHKKYINQYFNIDNRYYNLFKDEKSIANMLNMMLNINSEDLYHVGYASQGASIIPGPLWTRPEEMRQDPLPNYIQIVGHTPRNEVTIEKFNDLNAQCIYTDTFGKENYKTHIINL